MPRVIHFEVPADNPARATEFYGSVFGWRFHKWDGPEDYWLVQTGDPEKPGIDGGMMLKQSAGDSVVSVLDVPSVDDYSNRIEKAGGSIIVPKMSVQGVGYIAYFKDTEGNVFGIMQEDPTAE